MAGGLVCACGAGGVSDVDDSGCGMTRGLQALRAANAELVQLCWDIGESIHRKHEGLGWRRSVVENLARDLQAELPGRNGFSARNL